MGGSNSKEKAIKNIVKNNRNNLDEQKLEEIMMNTQFDEFEMLKLHEKFLSLDRNKRGKLTNREFLELDEFKCTPYRARLKYAFSLKGDDDVQKDEILRAETLKMETENKELANILNGKDGNEESKNMKGDMATGMEEAKTRNNLKLEEEKKKEDVASNRPDIEENKESSPAEEIQNGIDNDGFIKQLGTKPYIDFTEFCKYLAIFNPKYSLDEKVKFYFRIFDLNEDGKITDDDLARLIEFMYGVKENNVGMSEEYQKHLKDKLMKEADTGDKEYLDMEDIEKILWATNIEKKLSLSFLQPIF